jgi:hypothetical protein
MAYKLSKNSINLALQHLCRFGDTDVFPHLPELLFVRDNIEKVTLELQKLDLDNYSPTNAIEALAPKSKYGFRIVHQLPLVDTILLLAAVIELGSKIENHRIDSNKIRAFSYRFEPDTKGSIFRSDRTFKEWLATQEKVLKADLKIKKVIVSDISDFYARVNFHRLENLLDEVAAGHGAAKYIKKHIKVIRAKQSFGLPVGGSASRLLAELALSDTDKALENENRLVSRFVDDFRIFLRKDEEPYEVLAFLAEHLGINEGLSLNNAKTSVYDRKEFVEKLHHQTQDINAEAQGAALEALTADLYFEDNEPDEEELEQLKGMNLLGYLQEELGKEIVDSGHIKVIFRALKIAKPIEAIEYIKTNFSELVGFSKEVVLLMGELEHENSECFADLTDAVISTILTPPASSIQLSRTWLLELFVRNIVPISATKIKKLEKFTSPIDRRQLHLIRGRIGDTNYFRKAKTAYGSLSELEKWCLIWGASCLPKDEYMTWLGYIKPMFQIPLGSLFLDWAKTERNKLITKLSTPSDDQPE